jgi:hypothetical protein
MVAEEGLEEARAVVDDLFHKKPFLEVVSEGPDTPED